jgi:hypothetical protein
MSEEKLYVVEDDNRLHLAFNDAGNPMWFQTGGNFTATDSVASMWSLKHGGHVVTFAEEPEKVVLSEKQAEIVDAAHNSKRPASYIILKSNDEELLMNAFVNGYTVVKEKRYLLPMEGFGKHQGYSYMEDGIWYINTAPSQDYAVKHGYTVTKDEYDSAPNWVKILKPVEVIDDDD